ncbi:MAG: isoprenyl transferase [Gammaproteobacteria bacterium]|nr:isoprenyl transferase [Gammaproteobacteria bacterium]
MTDNSNSKTSLPRHVAIIMDGNGRWAKKRFLPRIAGHKAGVEAVRDVVRACAKRGVEALTLFAFSTENWRRPKSEVGLLMDLFMIALERESLRLHEGNVRLKVIGERGAFSQKLQDRIAEAEALTVANTGLTVVVAANYGGRWDITQATQAVARKVAAGELQPAQITEDLLAQHMSLHGLPEPDLFIRTGGEERISNFLLWQLAYTEFYFTETLWPDFGEQAFKDALDSFARRQRRFGRTGDQVEEEQQREAG